MGEELQRESRIVSVDAKHGRSGPLVFVTVRHEISGAPGLALTEEHDIVYRAAPQPGAPAALPQPAPADAHFARTIVPDEVLLFRFTALQPVFDTQPFGLCGRDEGKAGLTLWAQTGGALAMRVQALVG